MPHRKNRGGRHRPSTNPAISFAAATHLVDAIRAQLAGWGFIPIPSKTPGISLWQRNEVLIRVADAGLVRVASPNQQTNQELVSGLAALAAALERQGGVR